MSEAFVVIDLESTDREPEKAHIVEWAALVLFPEWFGQGGVQEHGGLVKPPVQIPAETSDVADAPTWDVEQQKLAALLTAGTIAVAHNAEYERTMLAKLEVPGLRWLCTYKAACRVWPDAPGFSNETLRYYLGLGTGRKDQQAAHSALHDARVTAQILGELLRTGTSIEDMLVWTEQPAMLPTCPLGDWRGRKWAEVDAGFLLWILRKIHDREDVRFCANAELERREKERAAARPVGVGTPADEDEVPF